jgi:large subunit ribosomal protein L17
MRHQVDRRKLGLPSDQRKHLLGNLARQLIRHGYVHTTLHRAKEVRRIVEPLITVAKNDSLHSRRQARKILVGHSRSTPQGDARRIGLTPQEEAAKSLLNGEDLVKYLFDYVAPRFKSREGGYTRITRTGRRRGDGALTAVIELID